MDNLRFLYDEPQEAAWFRNLDPRLSNIPMARIGDTNESSKVSRVLSYDRPDIVLIDGDQPILSIEETIEVPSGHNVGQRFARLAAASEASVPALYFGPYVAKKHGGKTAGPRYVNLRLFKALDRMIEITGGAVLTLNWPVDGNFEIRRDPQKDKYVREFIKLFLDEYEVVGFNQINNSILGSDFFKQAIERRTEFIETSIRRKDDYEKPPNSVEILSRNEFYKRFHINSNSKEILVYKVGMKKIRSDPYTGMAMLYDYLYVKRKDRSLALWFPEISSNDWKSAAQNKKRKDVRLYLHSGDIIIFSDGWMMTE
jgi:hypothetical protein